MLISDWSSDLCSSDLHPPQARDMQNDGRLALAIRRSGGNNTVWRRQLDRHAVPRIAARRSDKQKRQSPCSNNLDAAVPCKCRAAWRKHVGKRKGAAKGHSVAPKSPLSACYVLAHESASALSRISGE